MTYYSEHRPTPTGPPGRYVSDEIYPADSMSQQGRSPASALGPPELSPIAPSPSPEERIKFVNRNAQSDWSLNYSQDMAKKGANEADRFLPIPPLVGTDYS